MFSLSEKKKKKKKIWYRFIDICIHTITYLWLCSLLITLPELNMSINTTSPPSSQQLLFINTARSEIIPWHSSSKQETVRQILVKHQHLASIRLDSWPEDLLLQIIVQFRRRALQTEQDRSSTRTPCSQNKPHNSFYQHPLPLHSFFLAPKCHSQVIRTTESTPRIVSLLAEIDAKL